MEALINWLNGVIWSPALVYLCLGAGLYFSIRTRFLQVRHVGHMVKQLFAGHSSASGVSSFQALTMALSGRVGTGNIAGVATAIAMGGPGAIFWMWTVAFLGASTAYVEAALGQIYKEKDDNGFYRGGPAYFIEKAMGQKWYAWTFAVATIIAMGFCLPGIQANSIAEAVNNTWGVSPLVTSSLVCVFLALVIFGGVKRIAKFAEVVVPVMATFYILVALYVLATNIELVSGVFKLIVSSAFGVDAAFGGILGMAIKWGVQRGIYSNEAGQGTGPHHAAAAEVSHPAKQGLVQSFSVYIDTLFVCSATAFMILITGNYNVSDGNGGFLVENLPGVAHGPGYVQASLEGVMPGFGSALTAISLLFFAFTTIIAYYYVSETNVSYINRKVHRPWLVLGLKFLVLSSVMYFGLQKVDTAWGMADIGVGLMAWLNIIAIIILQKPALVALRDYEAQLKEGKQPVFDAKAVGVENAEFWDGSHREEFEKQ